MKPRAFTILELMVVTAITCLLVTILLPSWAKARDLANSVKCRTSLRAIGFAWGMYTTDYPGQIPPAANIALLPEHRSIVDLMSDYLGPNAWECPGDNRSCFFSIGTSYEYFLGIALCDPDLDPIAYASMERQLWKSINDAPSTWPIIGDIGRFHPSGNNRFGRHALFHDASVAGPK